MNVHIVADVGNSRIKWGVCGKQGIIASASLPPDEPETWQKQLLDWKLRGALSWAIGGVHPGRRKALRQWLRGRGDKVRLVARYDRLPIEARVDAPERVGVDRLLNAVAAHYWLRRRTRVRTPRPALVVDAGTAVTVDLISPDGAFEGGAIFPGRRLMAAALHDYTALLPLVSGAEVNPAPVGKNTVAAMEAGIHYAVAGGVNELIRSHPVRPVVFLTGGDAPLLQKSIGHRVILWPEMTLEGLRVSAEALP